MSDNLDPDLTALESTARAATKEAPGDWHIRFGGTPKDDGFCIASKGTTEIGSFLVCEHWPVSALDVRLSIGSYIVAAQPRVMLQLCETIRRLQAECERLRGVIKKVAYDLDHTDANYQAIDELNKALEPTKETAP